MSYILLFLFAVLVVAIGSALGDILMLMISQTKWYKNWVNHIMKNFLDNLGLTDEEETGEVEET